jgi:hypothetical protein
MHGLQVPRIELDEAWSIVGKKQKAITREDGPDKGEVSTGQRPPLATCGGRGQTVCIVHRASW